MIKAFEDNTKLTNEIYGFIKKIKKLRPEKVHHLVANIRNLNILVLGPIGSGKSSFINSLMSGLNQKYCEILNVRNSATRVTTSLTKIFLSENKKIRVCDTFGWGDEHFRSVCDLLIQGKLPDGYKISDPTDEYSYRKLVLDFD
jgi:septin family protein